jgi:hypothetical protein
MYRFNLGHDSGNGPLFVILFCLAGIVLTVSVDFLYKKMKKRKNAPGKK